jgi:PadR family transcriptional regulator, regulatory protein PadR
MVLGTTSQLLGQMRRGAIEYCVLAMLRKDERYGFDLIRELGETDGLVTSEGTIYPLLTRLRKDGLVESRWHESLQGPPRRYYQITKDGQAALEVFIEQWQRFRNSVDHILESGS